MNILNDSVYAYDHSFQSSRFPKINFNLGIAPNDPSKCWREIYRVSRLLSTEGVETHESFWNHDERQLSGRGYLVERSRERERGTGLVSCQVPGTKNVRVEGNEFSRFSWRPAFLLLGLKRPDLEQTFRGAPFTTAVSLVCANLCCLGGKLRKSDATASKYVYRCTRVLYRTEVSLRLTEAGMETRRLRRDSWKHDFNSKRVIWTRDG